jgi:hypothetical protein
MKSDEIKKGLREIKSFVISEIKNEESNWQKNSNRDEIEYKSKWLNIKIPCDNYSSSYSLKDIGLSKIRFNWIIKDVDFFIKNREKRQKMENIVNNWNNFLDKNKSLNRDKKLEKLLK